MRDLNDKTLMQLFKLVEEFRRIHPYMQVQAVATFVAAAKKPGITMKELRELTGTAQATCSRNVAMLCKEGIVTGGKYGLVYTKPDPEEPRRKIVYPTDEGIELAKKLSEIIRCTD